MKDQNVSIDKKDDKYIVRDTTMSEYLNRATPHQSQQFMSVYDKNLKLIEFSLDGREALNLPKEDYDYNRCKLAKSRHLKALKIHLGMEQPKVKGTPCKVLFFDKFYKLGNIVQREVLIKDKTLEASNGSAVKKIACLYTEEVSAENLALAEEYNKKVSEFIAFRNEIFKKIFGHDMYL